MSNSNKLKKSLENTKTGLKELETSSKRLSSSFFECIEEVKGFKLKDSNLRGWLYFVLLLLIISLLVIITTNI